MNERIAQLEATLREDTQEALKLHTRIVDLEQSLAKEVERSKRIELNLAAKIDELEKDKARLDWLDAGGCISWTHGDPPHNAVANTPKTNGSEAPTVREAIDKEMRAR